jgi:hypothetical protein
MRYALLFLMLAGCSQEPTAWQQAMRITGEEVTAKQDESLMILRENTAALQTIKSLSDKQMELDTEIVSLLKASLSSTNPNGKESDPESALEPQRGDTANDSHPQQHHADSPPAVRLFITSSEQAPEPFPCPPCQRLQKAIDAGEFAGFEIVWSAPFDGQRGFPATRFRSRTSPTGWRVIYGFDDSTIAQIRANIDGLARSEVMTGPLTGAFFQYPQDSAILSQRSAFRPDNRANRRSRRPVNSAFSWLVPSASNQW